MKPEARYCLYCQEEIKGRSDKLFCDPQCKSAFHNTKPNSNEAMMRNLNKQLRLNRGALRKACPMGKATVRKEFLKTMGMDFRYITHTWKGKGGQIYLFCYDYGYAPVQDPEKVLIIQQQDYMTFPEMPDLLSNDGNL